MKTRKIAQYGQGMTEYIIIVAMVAIAAIAAYQFFGTSVRTEVAGTAAGLSANEEAAVSAQAAAERAATEEAIDAASANNGAFSGIGGVGTIAEGGNGGALARGARDDAMAVNQSKAVEQARAMSSTMQGGSSGGGSSGGGGGGGSEGASSGGVGGVSNAEVEIKNIGIYKANDDDSNILLYIILGIIGLIAIFMLMRDSDKGSGGDDNPYSGGTLGTRNAGLNNVGSGGLSAGGASGGSSGVGGVSKGGYAGAASLSSDAGSSTKGLQPQAQEQKGRSADYDDDYPG